MKILTSSFLLLLALSFNAVAKPNYEVIANAFFQTYKERTQFDKFLTFYADDMIFEDVFYRVKLKNKEQFSEFYDWHKGDFDRLANQHILRLDNVVVEHEQIVARGEFLRFSYNGKEMGPWPFVIWLEFDEHGKIIKQQDWINYSQTTTKKGEY